jgi:NAD(P)-dependent dehydrogenase (short-subunit alcohol dehydrogenase family)
LWSIAEDSVESNHNIEHIAVPFPKHQASRATIMGKFSRLQDKHVLVIGGTKGIGMAVAEAAIEAGARVTISGSSTKSVDAAVTHLKTAYPSSGAGGHACDLSNTSVEDNLEALFAEAGRVDHVVYTAADSLSISGLEGTTVELLDRAGRMRYVAPIMVGKVAARHLARSRECSLTMTTGSIADKPTPGWSALAYLGAGLTGLTRNLALDMKPTRVNAVEAGVVDTGLWDAAMDPEQKAQMFQRLRETFPTGQVASPDDVAEAYIYLMKDHNATGEIVKSRSGGHIV